MNRQRFLPHALAVLTLARFLILPLTELSPPEAHAALCAERAELWYPLTGPVLPLLMRLSAAVFGMNEFGLRFFAPLLMLGAGLVVWKMAHGLFDATIAAWAAVLFQTVPVVNVAAVTFTNTTLAIAESAVLLALLRLALHRPLRFHLHWWAVAGLALLAFFTDWRLAAFSIAGTGSLMLTRRGRGALLKWPVVPILGGTFLLALTIFLAWNSEHGWAAFRFFPQPNQPPFWTVLHLALLASGPALLPLIVWVVVEASLQRPLSYAPAFLLAFAWPLLTLELVSLHTMPWPQAGFAAWVPPAVILAAAHLMQTERFAMRTKVWLRSVVVLAAALQSCIIVQPAIARLCGLPGFRQAAGLSSLLPRDLSHDLVGWAAAAARTRESLVAHGLDAAHCFLVTTRWQIAAPLAFYLRDAGTLRPPPAHPRVQVLPEDSGAPAFALQPPLADAAFTEATAIFITDDDARHVPPKLLRNGRAPHSVIAVFQIACEGRAVRTLKVFACPPGAADKSSGLK